MQLRDAESICVHHHHHGRVRNVDADLDHRRRDENVETAGGEVRHGAILLVRL